MLRWMGGPVRFGRFWLHERIGRGGMADVYRATVGEEPYRFSLEFALKRMHDSLVDDPMFVEMFLAEAYVQDLLHHPNIIRMYESGRLEGRLPYIAMELIRGRDLSQVMERVMARRIQVPVDVALIVALEVAKAIDFAHRARSATNAPLEIIHRDVSLDNIYLTFDGTVKLGDFGVARVRNFEPAEREGLVKGKAAYVSPETLLGEAPTQRDDLWALSVCLYEMLSSRPFFEDASDETIMRRVGAGRLPKIDLGVNTNRELEALLRVLLNPKATRRPQDAVQLYRTVRAFAKKQSMPLERENVGRFLLSVCGDVHVLATTHEQPVRDPLSGAVSRRHLHELLSREVDRARRYRRELSIVSFNIDGFSQVNTLAGATTGDDLLSHVVRSFIPEAMRLRTSDLVARRRGDHFTLVLPETPLLGARRVGERLRRCFRKYEWVAKIPAMQVLDRPLTVSVGVAALDTDGENATDLLRASDEAVARAKRRRGNRVAMMAGQPPSLPSREERQSQTFSSSSESTPPATFEHS